MERRFLAGKERIKVEEREEGKPVITGHAAVYYDGTPATEFKLHDRLVERISPKAFRRALKEGQDAVATFNHDPSLILGRVSAGTCRLESDKTGLRYEIDPGDTTVARDVREHIRRGDVTGSSFGFQVTGQTWRTEDRDGVKVEIREITDCDLFDVGPVTSPAYVGTDAAARDAGDHADALAALEAEEERRRNARAKAARARHIEILDSGRS